MESFLIKTKNATVRKRLLGSLTGREQTKATFTALVVSDETNHALKVRGLEIELEEGERKAKVFLDDDRDEKSHEDSLREFQEHPTHFADKDALLEEWRNHDPMLNAWVETTPALNRAASLPEWCCPRFTVFNAGWYRDGEELGVIMDAAGPPGAFYFPNVTLAEVVELLKAGRVFLNAN